MDSDPSTWHWLIGEITSPQGLKGEVRVYPHTDFPQRFVDLPQVGVQCPGAPVRVLRVERAQVRGHIVLLKLATVDTIDQADALRGARLVIPEDWAVTLEEDEYYHHQLLGLAVVTTTGESLGRITAIHATGANDVYETPLALIPAVKEYVRAIDLAAGRMVVEGRPGLKKSDPGT